MQLLQGSILVGQDLENQAVGEFWRQIQARLERHQKQMMALQWEAEIAAYQAFEQWKEEKHLVMEDAITTFIVVTVTAT